MTVETYKPIAWFVSDDGWLKTHDGCYSVEPADGGYRPWFGEIRGLPFSTLESARQYCEARHKTAFDFAEKLEKLHKQSCPK